MNSVAKLPKLMVEPNNHTSQNSDMQINRHKFIKFVRKSTKNVANLEAKLESHALQEPSSLTRNKTFVAKPRQYKRKYTVKGLWSEENLKEALEKLHSGVITIAQAQRDYGIPPRFLKRVFVTGYFRKKSPDPQDLLEPHDEKRIVDYVNRLPEAGFYPGGRTVRAIAYRIAEEFRVAHKFNRKEESAGIAWLKSFQDRHPELKVHSTEGRSLTEIKAMRRDHIINFVNILRKAMKENNMFEKPSHIFVMDECIIETNNTMDPLLWETGYNMATSGDAVSMVSWCNALGEFFPPVLICKCDTTRGLITDLPPGSKAYVNMKSANINTDLFAKWFLDHFLKHKPLGKVILLLDGHKSHCTSQRLFDTAIEKDVIIIGLPNPDIQPLVKCFFPHFMECLKAESQVWKSQNSLKSITWNEIGKLICSAFSKAATKTVGLSCFESIESGISPFNSTQIFRNFYSYCKDIEKEIPIHLCVAPENSVVLRVSPLGRSETSGHLYKNMPSKNIRAEESALLTLTSTSENEFVVANELDHIEETQVINTDQDTEKETEDMHFIGSTDNDTNEDPIKLECASTSGDNTMLTFECASTSGDNTMFQDNVESPTVIKKEEDVEFSEYESEANGSLSRENESNRGPAHGIGQDEYDAIGYNVASKLRHMEEGQRIIAEIIIAETLFRGQMGTLRVGDNCSTLCPTLPLKVEVEDIKFNPPVDDK